MAVYNGHQEDASGNILLPTPHSLAHKVELSNKSSQAYTAGGYLVYNNQLYIASKAIAQGDTLQPGNNLISEATSVGYRLREHNERLDNFSGRIATLESKMARIEKLTSYIAITAQSIDAVIQRVNQANSYDIVTFHTTVSINQLLTGKSSGATGYVIAKRLPDEEKRIDYTVFEPALGKIAMGSINTSTKAVTVKYTN